MNDKTLCTTSTAIGGAYISTISDVVANIAGRSHPEDGVRFSKKEYPDKPAGIVGAGAALQTGY